MSGSKSDIMNKIHHALRTGGPIEPEPGAENLPDPPLPDTPDGIAEMFRLWWDGVGGESYVARSEDELKAVLAGILSDVPPGPASVAPTASQLFPGLGDWLAEAGFATVSCEPDVSRDSAVGITGARMALAYSGSVLVSSEETGELAGSLLPPVHIALIPIDRLRARTSDALEHLRTGQPIRGAALITGASKTADIELTLVKGVHGPGRACAVILDYPAS